MVNTEIRLITCFAAKDGVTLYSQQKKRLGADCSSDHELLVAKFRLILKKAGKTIRPFRYDLNQIPCNHTVEVTNIFQRIRSDREPKELWAEVCNMVQEPTIKIICKK